MANFYWTGTANYWNNPNNWTDAVNGGSVPGIVPGSSFSDKAYFSANTVVLSLGDVNNTVRLQIPKTFAAYADVTIALVAGATEGWSNVGNAWTFTYISGVTPWYSVASPPVGAPWTLLDYSFGFISTISSPTSPTYFSEHSADVSASGPVALNEIRILGNQTAAFTLTGDLSTTTFAVDSGAGAVSVSGLDTYGVAHAGTSTLTMGTGVRVRAGVSTVNGNIVFTATVPVSSDSPSPAPVTFASSGTGTITIPAVSSLNANPPWAELGLGARLLSASSILTGNGGAVVGGSADYVDIMAAGLLVEGSTTFSGHVNAVGPTTISAGVTLTVGDSSGNMQTFSSAAPLQGAGSFVKVGTSPLILGAPSTRTGNSSLLGGTTKLNNATALGNGPVSVGPSAKLQLGDAASGKATLGGKLTINGGTLHIGG